MASTSFASTRGLPKHLAARSSRHLAPQTIFAPLQDLHVARCAQRLKIGAGSPRGVISGSAATRASHTTLCRSGNNGQPAYAAELQAAADAVRLASRLCKAVQLRLSAAETTSKDDESPVTVADYGAQALVAWSLSRAFPGAGMSMVAEETSEELRTPQGALMLERITDLVNSVVVGVPKAPPVTESQVLELIDVGGSPGGATGRHWVLDPIDGTRGFVGMRQYAVCLGMLQDGEVVLGVLGCPNLPVGASLVDMGGPFTPEQLRSDQLGVMFAAVKGQGTTAGPLEGGLPSTRVHCTDDSAPDCSNLRYMESFESRHSDHVLAGAMAAAAGLGHQPVRADSQVKYGVLARGDCSVFMRFPPTTYREKIWDHCAGAVIVEEAGGRITDALGAPLDFSQGRYLELGGPGIIAATPRVHEALLEQYKAQTLNPKA